MLGSGGRPSPSPSPSLQEPALTLTRTLTLTLTLQTHDEAFVVLTKEVNLRSSVEEVALMRERLEMCSSKDEP